MEQDKKRKLDDIPLGMPNIEGNVWPKQSCPAFTPRGGALLNECWYCVYADFHLDKPKPLEVGICYYPNKMIKETQYHFKNN